MSMIELATYAAVKKLLNNNGGGGGASAYTAKSIDELPSNAVDGSVAIVESDNLKGTWEWKDNQRPLDFGMFDFNDDFHKESVVIRGEDMNVGIFTIVMFEKTDEGVNVYLNGDVPLYLDGAFDDFYTTFDLLTDILFADNLVHITANQIREFFKTNCNRLSGGNALYILENGEWVYKGEIA